MDLCADASGRNHGSRQRNPRKHTRDGPFPAIGNGRGATTTASTTLFINAAPTIGTNNYALWVDAGASRFDGTVHGGNAAGPALMNEAATSTNPTLIPDRSNAGYGIGANIAGGELHMITNSVSRGYWHSGGLGVNGTVSEGIRINTGPLILSNAAGPTILNEAATSTNPTLVPNRADPDTGIGSQSADNLSLISGGTEGIRMSATRTLNLIVPHFLAGMQIFNLSNPGTLTGGVYVTARDSSAGSADSTLALDLETAPIVVGSFTASHKFPIWINNVEYHIQLDAV